MSFLSDVLDFEKFHTKDLWERLKDDPKRLLLGVDPWSTKIWNKVLGRDDEPLVDQMGGAYGGQTFSMGNPEGGVYQRAREAGIDTTSGSQLQDLAHVIAAQYAGGYGASKLPSFGFGGSERGFGQFNLNQLPNQVPGRQPNSQAQLQAEMMRRQIEEERRRAAEERRREMEKSPAITGQARLQRVGRSFGSLV